MKEIYLEKIARCPVNFKVTWGNKCEQISISEERIKMKDVLTATSTPAKLVISKFVSPEARKIQNICGKANMDPRKHGIRTEIFPSPEGAFDGKNYAVVKPKKNYLSEP